MSGWGVFALVILGLLLVVVAAWFGAEYLAARRRARAIAKYQPEHSVAAILARVAEEEAAERLSQAPTEVMPVVPAVEQPTIVIPVAPLPVRKQRYVGRRPSPYPRQRTPLQPPDTDVVLQVLDGLRQLDER